MGKSMARLTMALEAATAGGAQSTKLTKVLAASLPSLAETSESLERRLKELPAAVETAMGTAVHRGVKDAISPTMEGLPGRIAEKLTSALTQVPTKSITDALRDLPGAFAEKLKQQQRAQPQQPQQPSQPQLQTQQPPVVAGAASLPAVTPTAPMANSAPAKSVTFMPSSRHGSVRLAEPLSSVSSPGVEAADAKRTDPNVRVAEVTARETIPGFSMFLHGRGKDIVSDQINSGGGTWEGSIVTRIAEVLGNTRDGAPQRVFVDVGANVGWFSTIALALGHHVVSVEPFPYNHNLILATVAIGKSQRSWANGGLLLAKNALVAHKSKAARSLCAVGTHQGMNTGNAFMVPIGVDGTCGDKTYSSVVPTTTLDDVLNVASKRWDSVIMKDGVYALKIDIEGFEAEAMRGATSLLGSELRPCIILFEWTRAAQKSQSESHGLGLSEEDLLQLLSSHGYVLYEVGGDKDIDWKKDKLWDGDFEFRQPRGGRCDY